MTLDAFVRLTEARGGYGKYRAKCPVHKSRGATLAIYDDGDGIGIHCHAGCKKDDVLSALGLTWKDLKKDREWLPPKEYKAMLRKREADEKAAMRVRIKVRRLIDDTRKWESVACLLHAHLMYFRGKPEEPYWARLWRKSLATARDRHAKLAELWPQAPQIFSYRAVKMPTELTANFVGPEIAAALGLE